MALRRIARLAGLLVLSATFLGLTSGPTAAVDLNFATPRKMPPRDWPRLPWPEKRKILFGQYGPTEEEKRRIDDALPTADDRPDTPAKVLLFYRCQYPHVSIATGVHALQRLGESTGVFEATLSEDPDDFRPGVLHQYDAVLLLHTTTYEDTIGVVGQQALKNYVETGGGLVGIHAAADASKGWPAGAAMMGGVFMNHPWLPVETWAVKLESPDHLLNAAFGGKGFWIKEEIYAYRPGTFTRDRSRVLLSLDMSQDHNRTSERLHDRLREDIDPDGDYPIAWLHKWEEGRVFYSNLGHNPSTFLNTPVLKHYLDGVRYATGQLQADATPSATQPDTAIATAPSR